MTSHEAAGFADAAFAGTVVDHQGKGGAAIPEGAPAPFSGGETHYTFEVDGVAKGGIGEHAVVRAGDDGASCGVRFTAGERWLVFASLDAGALTTNLCAGNVPLAAGEPAPLPLVAPEPTEGPDRGLPIGTLLVAGIILGATLMSWLAFRMADRPT
jgi:hypothetical protein